MAGVKGRSGPPGNNNAGEGALMKGIIRKLLAAGARDDIEAAVREQIRLAKEEGNLKALEFIRDTFDGKPSQGVEVSGPDGGAIPLSLAITFKSSDAGRD